MNSLFSSFPQFTAIKEVYTNGLDKEKPPNTPIRRVEPPTQTTSLVTEVPMRSEAPVPQ
jgi:hypothetical protein